MRKIVILAILTIAGLEGACVAQTPEDPHKWRDECVGRMQLSMPGDVDVSALLPSAMLEGMKTPRTKPQPTFSDGQVDGYSKFQAYGWMLISHPLTDSEFKSLRTRFDEDSAKAFKVLTENAKSAKRTAPDFVDLKTSHSHGSARRIGVAIAALSRFGPIAVEWGNVEDSPNQEVAVRKNMQAFQYFDHATYRPPLAAPPSGVPGLCLPYLFIADGGQEPRFVAATYRLKSHPDITIWLQDSNGGSVPRGANPDRFTSAYDNEFWWQQNYRKHKFLKPIWRDLRAITLAGIPGHASLMEMTRLDDTIDFGFFASARDDANKVPDPTNLQMFVIRDAKNAIAKGIEPMSRDEFIKLAQAVAASVKRRPTESNAPGAAPSSR